MLGSRAGVPGPAHTTATSASRACPSSRVTTAPEGVRSHRGRLGAEERAPAALLEQAEVAGDGIGREQEPGLGKPERIALVGSQPGKELGDVGGGDLGVGDRLRPRRRSAIWPRAAAESRHTSPALVWTGWPSRASRRRIAASACRPSLIAARSGSATRHRRVGPLDDDRVFARAVAIDQGDLMAAAHELGGRGQAPRTGSDHDDPHAPTVADFCAKCRQQIVDNHATTA